MVESVPPPAGSPFSVDIPFPRFSTEEQERRWTQLRKLLDTSGCVAAVVSGSQAGRHELQYLTNAPVRWESFLVTPAQGDPHLFVQLFNHVPNIAEWSTVPVSWAGANPAVTVAQHLRALGLSGRIGRIGPWSVQAAHGLETALPGSEFVELNSSFRTMRLRKSGEEVAWLEYAAGLCDAAVMRFVAEARPGMREDELGALMEAAVKRQGGQLEICFLATASMAAGGSAVPRQVWSRRTVDAGDLAIFELSAGFGGYTGQVLRTVAIGADPPEHIQGLHELAESVFEAILARVRPGARAAELEEAAAIIDDASCTVIDDVVHGYAGGYLPPVVRTPGTRHAAPPDMTLEPGMCLVIQPNVVSADGRHGVQTGGLVTVTNAGARSLHTVPRGILRAA